MHAGDWRDSPEGLGGGRFAYSVDRVWAPAAARALAELAARGLVPAGAAPPPAGPDRDSAYAVALPAGTVRDRVRTYLATLDPALAAALEGAGLPGGGTLGSWVDGRGDSPFGPTLRFPALSLDAAGRPLPVMHSDALLRLALDLADPAERKDLEALSLPFPLGLACPAGILVANPAPTGDPVRYREFDSTRYHGTVAWGWVQALPQAAPAGPVRPLPADEELWGLGATREGLGPVPYGDRADAATESNALQLWSLVGPLLGLAAPAP